MTAPRKSDERKVEVLIVEDSPTQAEELRHLLEGHEYRVTVAANGREAIEAARRRRPTLILSDIVMPKMDGYALCRTIKDDKSLKDIPVILLTKLSDARDIIKGLECGADNFVRKPYDDKYLLTRIQSLLVNRQCRQSNRMQMGVEINLGGRKHFITSERQQMLDLLISIYEEAVHMNEELTVRQQELARSNRTLNGLYRIAEGINRCTSEQEVLDKALERAMELPEVRAGWVYLREGETGFRAAASRGLPPVLEAPGAMEEDCLCRRKLLSGELDHATNIVECERLQRANGDTRGLRYHASVPLWVGDQTLGVMNLVGADQGMFSDEDLKVLHGVGHQVAVALERARLVEHLEQMVSDRTVDLKHQATHDHLTGLPNRKLLYDRLRQAIVAGQRENQPVALLLMDLDRFKEINDTLGHHRGDVLLQQVGQRLRGVVWEPDLVARLGGDEFAVLFSKLANSADAHVVAQKILQSLEKPFIIEGLPIVVESSIGIAVYPDHGANADSLIQRADVAMYAAKETGSGCVIYDAKYDRHSPRRLALMGELRQAIDGDQLLLHYQPKIEMRTRRVVGVEALVRWRHPEHGLIPPDQFILPAEGSGLIHPLTRWVLSTALRQCCAWSQAGIQINVAVNLSRRNLQDQQLPDIVAELLSVSGVAPSCLDLEITESAIMADPVRAVETLMRLSKMGLHLSIDDFGTGYSSLASLKRLPVNALKIDKSFVIGMAADENDMVIVRSTIELAHNLGLKVVAEGVEDQSIWDRLSTLGCDEAQGYYLCRPIPAEDLTSWLSESPWRSKKAA
jgi:diguanylate cyclase (GGDEF)-like protein